MVKEYLKFNILPHQNCQKYSRFKLLKPLILHPPKKTGMSLIICFHFNPPLWRNMGGEFKSQCYSCIESLLAYHFAIFLLLYPTVYCKVINLYLVQYLSNCIEFLVFLFSSSYNLLCTVIFFISLHRILFFIWCLYFFPQRVFAL